MESMDRLVTIVAKLRGPGGCPWDREQTLLSLKKHLLEECYEVLEAMDLEGDELKGELGDLLLQVVLQSQIMKEDGQFEIDDVIKTLSEKLIRRHPHIFGEEKVSGTKEVLQNWEKIKAKEKGHQNRESILDGIPKIFPTLLKAQKLQTKAARAGFDFDSLEAIFGKIKEELKEVEETMENSEKLEVEIGDLLFSVVNLARVEGINPDIALEKSNQKFIKRFKDMESKGDLSQLSLEELTRLWKQVKS